MVDATRFDVQAQRWSIGMIRAICVTCLTGRIDRGGGVCPICFSAVRLLAAPVSIVDFSTMSREEREELRLAAVPREAR
jgi:hypothetical protein